MEAFSINSDGVGGLLLLLFWDLDMCEVVSVSGMTLQSNKARPFIPLILQLVWRIVINCDIIFVCSSLLGDLSGRNGHIFLGEKDEDINGYWTGFDSFLLFGCQLPMIFKITPPFSFSLIGIQFWVNFVSLDSYSCVLGFKGSFLKILYGFWCSTLWGRF